jgi:ABC-type dipeptide/oligopeptide/nickel transport system ATPase component
VSKLLEIEGLESGFDTEDGLVRAVDGVSFELEKGRTLGIVGESGCGKTVSAMSIVDLLPKPAGRILGGSISFKGQELRDADPEVMYKTRGNEIGVIFQEPMTALNPVQRVGKQIIEKRFSMRSNYWMPSAFLPRKNGFPTTLMNFREE